ncbi:PucC family protein [Sandaracinobacteroides saxicola]|uniref:PucC family protein n=1 Tax=Sandaracinobacteroides saxicola TaxID=2759707 RepID=A0A7G5IDS6_9SPHN|nr:PucC family protein [Sandaracinobacteroides saxicola]QMW21518.1 PucC family protein [Sandaracinobacteroides saxicola]
MIGMREKFLRGWMRLGTRALPFADAATPDLPLSRLLRLSLFQVSVGMALVLLIGTLNRVMIVELGVPAAIVGVMISLPLLFAPFRAFIGYSSDRHRSEIGWRRVPFIYRGTLLQFGGLAFMPMAILVLARDGHSVDLPPIIGYVAAALSFLLVGAGLHIVQTAGLALATDLAPADKRPQVVGLMYVMLLLGMIVSALAFGMALSDFSPGRLVQVIQAAALLTAVLNGVAVWKQEPRRARSRAPEPVVRFKTAWRRLVGGEGALRHLVIVSLGTMAFSMEDVLLEPYGGQILGLAVAETTRLTAALAVGGLFGFALASHVLSRGADAFRLACAGVCIGIPAFVAVIAADSFDSAALFAFGTAAIGFGAGLFGHGTLTATMNRAAPGQAGLALGAWGSAQATAAGLAIALGGILRDLVASVSGDQALGYHAVYALEILLLGVTLAVAAPLLRPLLARSFGRPTERTMS